MLKFFKSSSVAYKGAAYKIKIVYLNLKHDLCFQQTKHTMLHHLAQNSKRLIFLSSICLLVFFTCEKKRKEESKVMTRGRAIRTATPPTIGLDTS